MNWKKWIRSVVIVIVSIACVDKLSYDLEGIATIVPVVFGYISDQPGPYQISVSNSFDIEQDPKSTIPLSVKRLTISDNTGLSEELTEVREGLYQTSPTGIQGIVGRAYTLRIELFNGRVYESFADTLFNSGSLDSIYFDFVNQSNANGSQSYGFDIYFNATASVKNDFRFIWKFAGTFQAETNPEYAKGCFMINGKCNFMPACTGLLNVAVPAYPPSYERIGPCECCTCWYTFFNNNVFLNDDRLDDVGRFHGIKLYELPLDAWFFTHKVHFKIDQLSVTHQTFRFFKSIKDQQAAVNSIFQPVNGKIPSNFAQIEGDKFPIAGIFYAASISSKSDFILRSDVPNELLIPNNKAIIKASCLEAFPHGTNEKPSFWGD